MNYLLAGIIVAAVLGIMVAVRAMTPATCRRCGAQKVSNSYDKDECPNGCDSWRPR